MSTVRVRSVVVNPVNKADGSTLPFLGLEDLESRTGRILVSELPVKEADDSVLHRAGDVLFSKLRPYLAKSYLPKASGSATGELLVLRPSPAVDARFLFYVTLSAPWIEWANTTSYGTRMPRTSWELLSEYRMWLPGLEEQRRIADFLDTESTHIDRLRLLTERQVALMVERRGVAFHRAVELEHGPSLDTLDPSSGSTGWAAIPLNRLLKELTNGYVGPTRDILVETGVRYLQSLHIKDGRVDFDRRPYFVPEAWARERPRIRLGVGDVLIVQTGAIGEVAIVDENYAGSSCHALLIARTNSAVLESQYLWHAFRSYWGKNTLLREQTGALHPHLEAGNVRFIALPISDLSIQRRVVARVEDTIREVERVETLLTRRLNLQIERRQALITAAVTGQVDVSTASGRGIED